ncbi:MAG: phosphoglycerate kinase, partial [Halobacteria archaeon]|nr:phosphoglycerate kinase [Halobacteria archaeon]
MAQDIDPGKPTRDFIEKEGYTGLVDDARELLDEHGELIETPSDVAVEVEGERAEVEIDELPSEYQAFDIGVETIARYSKILREGATVIVNGPPGVYEEEVFSRGTQAVLEAASEAGFSIAGGGDTSAAIDTLGVKGFDHISSGGGAALALLSGQDLPGVEALKQG